MQVPAASPKEALRAITVFFYSMLVGLLLFTVIVFALDLIQPLVLTDKSAEPLFLIAVLVIAIIATSTATRLYNKRLGGIGSLQLTLPDKLGKYRAALVHYLALCEGAGLIAVITYFLTGNKLLLVAIAFVLFAMLLKRPVKSKIFNDLQLSFEEQSELN